MKRTVTSIFVLLFTITSIYAQQFKPSSIVRAKHSSYKIDTIKFDKKNIHIENSTNKYSNKPSRQGADFTFEKVNKSGTYNAFKEVFSDSRLKQLANERILIIFNVSLEGKIQEIEFTVNKNTLITIPELEALEGALKANVSFKFKTEELRKGSDFVSIGQAIPFSRVLDKTLIGL
ncbi:MAG: hypothetical protein ACXVAY_02050 [Mucilaginibacter sp.]